MGDMVRGRTGEGKREQERENRKVRTGRGERHMEDYGRQEYQQPGSGK
jgi:hypothetical protein